MAWVDLEIPYGEQRVTFGVHESALRGVFQPKPLAPVPDASAEIARALSMPIGGPGLRELVASARHVVLVADDLTRATPMRLILPMLLDDLHAAGVPDDAIEVVIALGTHRPMSPGEIEERFGPETVRRIAVHNHEAFSPNALVDLGQTPSGVPVQINRRVVEADLVIGVGSIVPHHIAGFSGGAKIIQPGVCGQETTGMVHLSSVRQGHSLLGILENSVRREMETIAERAGLRAILNTVLDSEGQLLGAAFGGFRKAFRAGVALSREAHGVRVPAQSDIVVASSHPCDLEFWQAHKTLYAAELCVRPGGTIIVVTPCPEGLAVTHPEMIHFAGRSYEEIDAAIRAGEIPDLTAGALGLAWANIRRRARILIVSEGLSQVARAVGFEPYATVDGALAAALKRHGPQASITVLPHAPDTLPLLEAHPGSQ
jgi:nickel-dependent lactate racemase